MLPARHRLTHSVDFAAVTSGGSGATRAGGSGGLRTGSRLIVVHVNAADARAGQPPRVGFVVSKAVGGAVVRNRTKRILRALMSQRVSGIPLGTDVVVRAKGPAAGARTAVLGDDLDRLLGSVLRRLAARRESR